jgi:hypothetical protein
MYTQKKPIDNTHIVRERDRRRNRELLAVLSLGVPIGLFLLLFTWQNLEVIRLGREATRLQNTLKQTETEHKLLEAELDRMTSFLTVEQQAAQMGFAPADPKTIVMVEERGEGRGARGEGTAVPAGEVPAAAPQVSTANRQLPTANPAVAGGR